MATPYILIKAQIVYLYRILFNLLINTHLQILKRWQPDYQLLKPKL